MKLWTSLSTSARRDFHPQSTGPDASVQPVVELARSIADFDSVVCETGPLTPIQFVQTIVLEDPACGGTLLSENLGRQ